VFSIRNIVMLGLMGLFAGLAAALRPTISLADERPPISLKTMVPMAFGDWRQLERSGAHIIDPQTQQKLDAIYSETLTRTYINSNGYQIMLSIAYGKNQSDALQLHKPEVCYPAQGFQLFDKHSAVLDLRGKSIQTTRLMTKLNQRQEPVTYWTVVGDHVTVGGIDKKITELRYALNNRIPDGMLIRVSSIDGDVISAYTFQDKFAQDLVLALSPSVQARFAGVTVAKNTVVIDPPRRP
jgi:EpsI family protein